MSEREGSGYSIPARGSAGARAPTTRWLGLLGLLLGEYLWISLSFDARPLVMRAGVSGVFGYLGIAAPLLVVMAASVYVLAGERLRADASALVLTHGQRAPLLPCVLVNLAGKTETYRLKDLFPKPFDVSYL